MEWNDFDDVRTNYYLCYEDRELNRDVGILLFDARPSLEQETEWFSSLYRKARTGETLALVAVEGGHAIGLCTIGTSGLGPSSETSHVGDLGILVHREYRGRGVGRALMREALLRSRGKFERIVLWVFSNNLAAKRLYTSLGFENCGHLPGGVKRGREYIDEELMMLVLSPKQSSGSS